ncbi:ATP-binding protein [Thalassoglobus sp.]|uniref:ATP-binding protein n=1 Tax=Thalassoglobus sp. TaxID=2795869 RepID=UPI003AA9ADD2
MTTPLVNEQRFIEATRDTGYRSTSTAIAELVDNAIQAGASIVRIFTDQTGVGVDREISIAVLDNGTGMDTLTLSMAMQFAGSTRFNDRSGLGRFGMGLPNSSVSQARRVDVYSWQDRGKVNHTYLDVDEIIKGDLRSVPFPRRKPLPNWADKHVRKRTGTLVAWSRCDRLDNRKATTIADKLHRSLGQKFRYYLWDGNKIYINDTLVAPFDPMYFRVRTGLESARPFGGTLTLEFRVPADPHRTSSVEVRFAELPIDAWYDLPLETRRELGITKGAGVSVVRSGREIDHGWYFMGTKRKENYDDWWRCEVRFEPELDELFGVTHSKQEINPCNLLRFELSQHLEGIAQSLNSRVRMAFAAVKKKADRPPTEAESVAEKREQKLPALSIPLKSNQKLGSHSFSSKRLKYRLDFESLNTPDLYVWSIRKDGTLSITVNQNHAFCEQLFGTLKEAEHCVIRHRLECLFLALARAELACTDETTADIRFFRRTFGNLLATYLGD